MEVVDGDVGGSRFVGFDANDLLFALSSFTSWLEPQRPAEVFLLTGYEPGLLLPSVTCGIQP